MELNVGKEIAVLKRMTVGELRERYAEVLEKRRMLATSNGLLSGSSGGCSRCPRATFPSGRARVRRNWRTMLTCGDERSTSADCWLNGRVERA